MLFSNRDKFDLIALYDDASSSFNESPALTALMRAIYELAFRKILKNMPMILVGGLRAWKEQFPNDIVHGSTETTVEHPGPSLDPIRHSDHSPIDYGLVSSSHLSGTMAPLSPLPASPALVSTTLSSHSRAPAESSTAPMYVQQMASPPLGDSANFTRTISGGPLPESGEYKVWMPPPGAGTPAPPELPAALR